MEILRVIFNLCHFIINLIFWDFASYLYTRVYIHRRLLDINIYYFFKKLKFKKKKNKNMKGQCLIEKYKWKDF